jgi:molecular chaperone DnaK
LPDRGRSIPGNVLSDDDKKAIEAAVAEAENHQSSDDKEELEAAVKALNDAIMPIGAKMYQQSADEAKTDEKKSDSKKADAPVEGEVVDEK